MNLRSCAEKRAWRKDYARFINTVQPRREVWLRLQGFSLVRRAEFIILHVGDLGEGFNNRFGEGAGSNKEAVKHAETLCYRTLSFTNSAFHTLL